MKVPAPHLLSSFVLCALVLARPFDEEPSRGVISCFFLALCPFFRVSLAVPVRPLPTACASPSPTALHSAATPRLLVTVSHILHLLSKTSPHFSHPSSYAFSLIQDHDPLSSRTTSELTARTSQPSTLHSCFDLFMSLEILRHRSKHSLEKSFRFLIKTH